MTSLHYWWIPPLLRHPLLRHPSTVVTFPLETSFHYWDIPPLLTHPAVCAVQTRDGCGLVPLPSWLWLLAVRRGHQHTTELWSAVRESCCCCCRPHPECQGQGQWQGMLLLNWFYVPKNFTGFRSFNGFLNPSVHSWTRGSQIWLFGFSSVQSLGWLGLWGWYQGWFSRDGASE